MQDITEMTEVWYNGFKAGDEKMKAPNGKFICPYRACRVQFYHDYTSILEHAIRVSERSLSVEQRAKHSAMVRYLAIDISNQLVIQKYSDEKLWHSNVTKGKSSKYGKKIDSQKKLKGNAKLEQKEKEEALDKAAKLEREMDEMTNAIARAEQGEKEALDKAAKTETKMDEMTKAMARAEQREKVALDKAAEMETEIDEMKDKMNALIAKEQACNSEDRKELVKVTTLLMHQITSILRAVEP